MPTVRTGAAAVPVILLRRSWPPGPSQSSARYIVSLVLSSVIEGAIVNPHPSSEFGVALDEHVVKLPSNNEMLLSVLA